MTERSEADSVGRIEATRRIQRRAADLCCTYGASVEEAAIGTLYTAFDVAERHAGQGALAIEWLRTACDVLEASLLAGGVRRGANG